MKKLFALTFALILALSLALFTGCGGGSTSGGGASSPPSAANSTANPPSAASNSTTRQTDNATVNNSSSEPAESVALPDGWPSTWPGDVPTLAGTIQNSGGDLHSAAGLSVSVEVTDVSVFNDWVSALDAKGFTKIYDTDTGNGGRSIGYSNNTYTVLGSYLDSANLASIGVSAN